MAEAGKLGIYGGTFDPIHHGHLILARQALEELQLDRIVFVPAAVSPHKLGRVSTPAAVRLKMLRAAVAEDSGFEVDDIELSRPPPSFTVDTVEEYRCRAPAAELFYLVGLYNLRELHTWHRFDDLRKATRFAVLARGTAAVSTPHPVIRRLIDISGTDIRNRVATGQPIRYLVPQAVEEIIRREQLYKDPARSLPKN